MDLEEGWFGCEDSGKVGGRETNVGMSEDDLVTGGGSIYRERG